MLERSQNRISAINSPHELALGIAFGVVIGLMPKDSVIPWAIGLVFLLSRANLLCGIVAVIGMSIVSPSLDAISDKLGMAVLSTEFLQSTFASWTEIPWVGWTRFNNTVVTGSLALGVLICVPIYCAGQIFFRLWGIAMIERVMNTKLIRAIFGEAEEPLPEGDNRDPSLITET
ncbi:TIGR03546 family protein [Mariniblastus fucicola]|uniref:DUF2062 domain-containing protein n=1 Tax=Mariniblastus fucicola TaxID=980251 RepID=A0A5B9PEZ4_9BACT|nr:TIGR03546 family protein [Mariniblastus fucicola]QEG23452.1 hypothetical protein MFFC18_33510 [Mariniblastus fucicola]